MEKGQMQVTILRDGRVKVTTGDMSGENHQSADDFLAALQTMLGGEVVEAKIEDAHTHTHDHGHTHDHVHGGGHSHSH